MLLFVWAGLGLDFVQHFDCSLDGGFDLVGIEATGLELRVVVAPRDDGLNKRVGAASGGDGNGVVREHGEGAAE